MTGPPPPPRGLRKWVRRGAKLVLWLLAIGILSAIALVAGLNVRGVRAAILGWAVSAIEDSSGIRVDAGDFSLSLRTGEIRLYDLELRADGNGSDPFLVVAAVEAEVSWGSLLRDRPTIYSIRIHEPALDLGAPMPRGADSGGTESGSSLPSLDIHHLEIVGGSIRSGAAPGELDEWFDSWQLNDLTLVGSLVDGNAEIEVQGERLTIESRRRPRITLALAAALAAGENREFAIHGLELVGDALELRLDGEGRLESGAPVDLSVDLRADLARLVPDLTTSGRIEASGQVTLTPAPAATLVGDLRLLGEDFPAELLEPLLALAGREGMSFQGTQLDLAADLETRIALDNLSAGPSDDAVRGEANLTWRRQDEPLLLASIRSSSADPEEDPSGITLAVDVRVLPLAEGSRSLAGRVYLPGWNELERLELRDLRMELREVDLRSLTAELGLTPEAFGGFQPSGSVTLIGTADGPVASPDLDLEGNWQLDDRRLVELSARAAAMSNLTFHAELLPDSPGVRRIQGGWAFPGLDRVGAGSFENVRLEIDLPDLQGTLGDVDELLDVFLPDPDRREALVAALGPEIREHLKGRMEADLIADGPLASPGLELTARWMPTESEQLSVEASYDEGLLTLKGLTGALEGLLPGEQILRFAAQGRLEAEAPVRDAELTLQIFDPIEEIDRLDVTARLEDGTLTLRSSTPSVPGRIEASVPLSVLPLVFDPGSLKIEIDDLDLGRASDIGLKLAGLDPENPKIDGVLDARVALDPSAPVDALATVEIEGLTVTLGENRIESRSDLRVDLADRHIAQQPARLVAVGAGAEAPLELALSADLNPEWQFGSPLEALLENLDLDLSGSIDSSLLTPFLAGGVAEGSVHVTAHVAGSPGDFQAELRLSAPDSSLLLPGKYRTRISELEVEVGVDPSGAEIRTGRMRLNRGEVELGGSLGEDEVLRLAARLRGVRYRLDYGLTVEIDGDLELTWPREGRRRLSGTIDLERGSLRRDLKLEQELMRMLNPSDLAGSGSAFQQSVDLDLDLVTREGVRIKNNLADLRADWDLIRVRGTLAQPTIAGRIDVDPGGFVTAYGQTVRIDQGALIFTGVPGEPPRMDFETTSSAEDPRLRNQWNSVWATGPERGGPGGDFWDRYDPQSGSSAIESDDLTSYVQTRFLQSISGGAPRVELSVQPLPLMGETDTTARVTMSYHLNPQISYVLSQNPREAEGRTDILNLHNFAVAPSLQGQLFRNDQGNHGVTVQQVLEFGGGRRAEDAMPRVRSLELAAPKEVVRKRHVRRATGLRKGQLVAEGADFDIEIDMLDSLARRGYPAASVGVEIESAPKNRVIVGITVEPGVRVDFEFSGDTPRRSALREIVALYQPTGRKDSPALESIRRDTVRALRARGFVDPQVKVTAAHADPENPASDRIVRVHGEGGRQIDPVTIAFPALPDDVSETLAILFSSRLSRVELASGQPDADGLLIQFMQTAGYSQPRILSRELSSDGSALVVEVEPGPRRHLASVQILGVGRELHAELDGIRALGPGDPIRSDQIARTALGMEDQLRERGFADAEVRSRLEPVTEREDGKFDLFFDVRLGREHRIGELGTEGLANSSPRWVKKVSRLETGELLTQSSLVQARRRLARTGIFQRIAIRREEPVEPAAASIVTPITLELEEHPRYRVTYGLRGETTREAGAVADVSDLNFLGRGQTLGLRLIYATLERNARLYWSIPRVRQTNKNLEFFVEARREESVGDLDDDEEPLRVVADSREAWAQLTFPAGKRSVHRFYTVYKQSVTEDRSDPASEANRVVSPFSGWQVSFDTGERSFFETSTDKITLFLGSDLSFASESLGSDFTGYGLFGQIKPQIPLIKTAHSALVWVHNYRVGLKESRGGVELPFFDRLFAGGEFSVRGYPTNSLGPISDSGFALGGEAMFITNQELRFPIWTLLSGVAFFDAGNVWETLDDVESTLFTSAGAGLRAESPVGPLRLDVAFPLDRREGDPEYKIYFGLGQTF